MGFFKSLFSQSNEKNNIKQIAGFPISEIELIKKVYSADNRFTARLDLFEIKQSEVLKLLESGFNPCYLVKPVNSPYFLRSENIEVLKLFEYFDFDIKFNNGFPKDMNSIHWYNPELIYFYKDVLQNINHKYISNETDLKILMKYKEMGVSFKAQKEEYDYRNSYSSWYCIDNYNDYKKEADFIIYETDFNFMDEFNKVDYLDKLQVFVWFIYFDSHYPNYKSDKEKTKEEYKKFFVNFSGEIDFTKKTSTGVSFFDFYSVNNIPEQYRDDVLELFKEYGLDYDNYINDLVKKRETKTNNVQSKKKSLTYEENEAIDLAKDQNICITQEEIDEIKKSYKTNKQFTSNTWSWKGENYNTLPRHKIIEALKQGLNPNQYIAYDKKIGYAPFFLVMHEDDLKILEQFGADIFLKSENKDRLKAVHYINFALFDFFSELILSSDIKYITYMHDYRKLKWLVEHNYNFTSPTHYSKLSDVINWVHLTNYDFENKKIRFEKLKNFILNDIKIDLNQIIFIGKENKEYIYWWILFYQWIVEYHSNKDINYNIQILEALINEYQGIIDINALSPAGNSFVDIVDLLDDDWKNPFLEMLDHKGFNMKNRTYSKYVKIEEIVDEKYKNIDVIGGFKKVDLEKIKKLPKNKDYSYYDVVITESNVLSELKKGFDPNYIYVEPVCFMAPNQNIESVFEYFGVDYDKSLSKIKTINYEYFSDYMFIKYLKYLMKMKPSIFNSINKIDWLKLLHNNDFDFNSVDELDSTGWGCLIYNYSTSNENSEFILKNTKFNFNILVDNDLLRPIFNTKVPSWFLYALRILGNDNRRSKNDFETSIKHFESIIKNNVEPVDIYQMTQNGSSVLWVFSKNNVTIMIMVLNYFMYQYGLNPYYKNQDNISFVDIISKNGKYQKVIDHLNNQENIDIFKNNLLIKVDKFRIFENEKEEAGKPFQNTNRNSIKVERKVGKNKIDLNKIIKVNIENFNSNIMMEIFNRFDIFDEVDFEEEILELDNQNDKNKADSIISILDDVFSILSIEKVNIIKANLIEELTKYEE